MFNNSIKIISDFLKRKSCICYKKEQTKEEEKKEKTTGQLDFKIGDDKVVHIHPPCSCAWCNCKCIIFSRCEREIPSN